MKKTVRKAVIAGNWKMNKTRPEAKELLEAIKPLVANAEGKVEVIACVPFTNLETAVNATANSRSLQSHFKRHLRKPDEDHPLFRSEKRGRCP